MINNIEVGDRFTINWKNIKKIYPNLEVCNQLNKEFTVVDFSKSGFSVYFDDNRTNKKGFNCNFCIEEGNKKCISINNITITYKKIQYDRDKKLNKILI
jgi:hypothetical protein